jgi:hypothetical protein
MAQGVAAATPAPAAPAPTRRLGVGLPALGPREPGTSANLMAPQFKQAQYVIRQGASPARRPILAAGQAAGGANAKAVEVGAACLAALARMDNLSRLTFVGRIASELGLATPASVSKDADIATGNPMGVMKLLAWVGSWTPVQAGYLCSRLASATRPSGQPIDFGQSGSTTGLGMGGAGTGWGSSTGSEWQVGDPNKPIGDACVGADCFEGPNKGGGAGAGGAGGWNAGNSLQLLGTGLQAALGGLGTYLQYETAQDANAFRQQQLQVQTQLAQQQMNMQNQALQATREQQATAQAAAAAQAAQAQQNLLALRAQLEQQTQAQATASSSGNTAAAQQAAAQIAALQNSINAINATTTSAMSDSTKMLLGLAAAGLVGGALYMATKKPAPAAAAPRQPDYGPPRRSRY